jgi:very-short-patch-repair endonuclease
LKEKNSTTSLAPLFVAICIALYILYAIGTPLVESWKNIEDFGDVVVAIITSAILIGIFILVVWLVFGLSIKGSQKKTSAQTATDSICESPIEKRFWDIASRHIPGLIPQYQIGNYRVDFALPQKYIAVELDGHEYHKTKAQRTADAKRERDLQEFGWQVIRFTGTEINQDTGRCVQQLKRICEQKKV